ALPLTEPHAPTRSARWAHLEFRVALGREIRGRVYEDEGEGEAPGAWSELLGSFDGRRLELRFLDRASHPREAVFAQVWGVAPPARGVGLAYQDGVLRLDLRSGEAWAEWDG
ncbi:MAG: alpha-glucosidase, partial [Meiothermus sp.]|nr:alpha-glucosidase [Meiothermus sp.]